MNRFESFIPSAPREEQIADSNGNLTPEWSAGLAALYGALQSSLTSEGFQMPSLSQTDIDEIALGYQAYVGQLLPPGETDISGTIVYDVTNRVLKCFVIEYDVNQVIVSAQWKTIMFV